MEKRWILKGLVESAFVVASILMALAVDEYSQNRDYADLADQSLRIFEREINQNRARVEDVAPYHQGIRQLLGQMRATTPAAMDSRPVMEGLTVPVLLDTAWETALATGAMAHMDFEIVSALSLTYSIQKDFEERSRLNRPRFVGPETVSEFQNRQQVDRAFDFVSSLARDESDLLTIFDQALETIAEHRGHTGSHEPTDTTDTGDEPG
jgi:hypothetical protein